MSSVEQTMFYDLQALHIFFVIGNLPRTSCPGQNRVTWKFKRLLMFLGWHSWHASSFVCITLLILLGKSFAKVPEKEAVIDRFIWDTGWLIGISSWLQKCGLVLVRILWVLSEKIRSWIQAQISLQGCLSFRDKLRRLKIQKALWEPFTHTLNRFPEHHPGTSLLTVFS